MSVSECDLIERALVDAGAVELIPESYCAHLIGERCRVWAVRVDSLLAEFLLSRNENNRRLMKSHVDSLSKVLSDEDWMFNGKTICVDTNGQLLDGQHRLHAAAKSRAPMLSFVVTGLSPECFSSIDTVQRTRTTAQVFEATGEKHSVLLAAAIRQLHIFCETGGLVHDGGSGKCAICPANSQEILDKNPGLRDSVAEMNSVRLYRSGVSGMLHYLFSLSDQRLADDFAHVLRSGEPGRPFNLFREFFINYRSSGAPGIKSTAAKAIKAFNAEKVGREIEHLSFRTDENFPQILGLDYRELKSLV